MFTFRFDMRAPATGAPAADLYQAAIEMAAFAERRGLAAAVLCEHHGSPDGYLPAPLILATALAARTERLSIKIAIFQLPLYHPIRLAEHMTVLDILSRGRVSYVGGIGYVPAEYEASGIDFRRRGRIADAQLELLLKAVTGEPFEQDGRRIHVTPPPFTPGGPAIAWGGGSVAAATRAGRLGLDLLAQSDEPVLGEAYEQACRDAGLPVGQCMLPPKNSAQVVFVADDLDAAWAELGPYLMHDVRAYAAWNEAREVASVSRMEDAAGLRAENRSHRILTVDQAVAMVRAGLPLPLHPLIGGLPPAIGWRYLETVTDRVMPALAA